jgi:hypothetical protein
MNLYDYENKISYDDVVKLLFELKKDQHATRVMRLAEELKRLQGQLEVFYAPPADLIESMSTPRKVEI